MNPLEEKRKKQPLSIENIHKMCKLTKKKNCKLKKSNWQIAQEAQTQCRLWHNVNCHIKTGKKSQPSSSLIMHNRA